MPAAYGDSFENDLPLSAVEFSMRRADVAKKRIFEVCEVRVTKPHHNYFKKARPSPVPPNQNLGTNVNDPCIPEMPNTHMASQCNGSH